MTRYRLSGALLAVLLLILVTGTASATPPVSSVLTLSVGDPNGPATVVELTCAPEGGTHPLPEPACDELVTASGNFDELPGYQQFVACTMEYRPLVTTAIGTWEGHAVYWRHEHSNHCTMLTATGTVFDF